MFKSSSLQNHAPRAVLAFGLMAVVSPVQAVCTAEARGAPPRVVELYTSQGCNSCPPADRWLSAIKPGSGALAAAFHVDYWDRLGWRDPFGQARFTARQASQTRQVGARFSYTPQVIVDGQDWARWPQWPQATPRDQGVAMTLTLAEAGTPARGQVQVQVLLAAGLQRSPHLRLWWAEIEDGHRTPVRAGENAGATLVNDHVVLQYGELALVTQGSQALQAVIPVAPKGARRLLVVATEPNSSRPLQALQLAC